MRDFTAIVSLTRSCFAAAAAAATDAEAPPLPLGGAGICTAASITTSIITGEHTRYSEQPLYTGLQSITAEYCAGLLQHPEDYVAE